MHFSKTFNISLDPYNTLYICFMVYFLKNVR